MGAVICIMSHHENTNGDEMSRERKRDMIRVTITKTWIVAECGLGRVNMNVSEVRFCLVCVLCCDMREQGSVGNLCGDSGW